MELFNQLFYLSYGVIVLIICLGAFPGNDKKAIFGAYQYWPIALILMMVASLSFYAAGFSPQYFLSLGNVALVFSGLATMLFIRSWRVQASTPPAPLYWLGFVGFLIFYELMRRYSSLDARLLLMIGIISSLNLWGLFEIFAQPKKNRTHHFYVLALAFIFQIAVMVLRVYVTGSGDLRVNNIYQENELPTMLRAIGLASNLLVYIAIGNILLERLWKREERKSSDAELKMLSSLNALAMARDNETGSHIIRTQSYVKLLAERLRMSGHYLDRLNDKMIDCLFKAAPLHDIGKVGIPDNILYKNGPLNKDEWGIMKTHTTIGEQVLSSAKEQLDDELNDEDVIRAAIDIAGSHHERWDGHGYPKGIANEAIPLSARIMALADMYDALVSERVYKPAWSHQDAVKEILQKRGLHFDPLVVDAFVAEQQAFQLIAQQYQDNHSEFKAFDTSGQSHEHKLQRSEEKFQILFEHSPIGMALIDHASGEFLEVNAALLTYTDYTKDEFLKLSFWDITPPEYAAQDRSQIEQLNQKGFFGPIKKEYIRKDGSRFPISIRGFVLDDVDGRKMVWGIIEDTTIKQKTLKRNEARNAVLELLAKNSPTEVALFQIVTDVEREHPNTFCSILLLNEDKKSFTVGAAPRVPQFFNEAVESLRVGPGVGCCGDAVATGQKSIAENLETHPNWAAAKSLVEQAGFKSCWSLPVHSSKGEVLGTFATYRKETHVPTADEIAEIEAATNLVSIVLERKMLENQVQKLALYDYLTGLPNRYLLIDRIKLAMAVSKRSKRYGAILFLDLDKLKELNDRDGHHAGDMLLSEAARRMQSCVRESDTVARFGGDEFVIVLPEISADFEVTMERVKVISRKILADLVEPYQLHVDGVDISHRSSASIGCRIFFDDTDTPEHVLKLADMSMYRAKKLGGNRIDLLF